MTQLTTVPAFNVEDGQVLHRIPGSDGVVVAHDVDDRGWETFRLGNGHVYGAMYRDPVAVVITQDLTPGQVARGDLIVRDGLIVRVVGIADARGGDRYLRWASDERHSDGTPVVTGLTHIRARHLPTVRIRLIDRPSTLKGVAW